MDIIHTHILTRLDGATLATASSVSSELRHLCATDEDLWRNVCTATWPSLLDPIASRVISTFPGGHRSFFSDALPSLHHHHHLPSSSHDANHLPPKDLISAVDIYFKGKPLFSKVELTETHNNFNFYFLRETPLPVDVFLPNPNPWNEYPGSTIEIFDPDYKEWVEYLQENLTLSWIVIDPARKRAANLSSWKPVSVKPVWMEGPLWCDMWDELEVVYAVVIMAEGVRCMVKGTCFGDEGEDLHVMRARMVMEDIMDGSLVRRREGSMIVEKAMEIGERKKLDHVRAKEMFHSFRTDEDEEKESSR